MILLDTHVLVMLALDPRRLSKAAARAIARAVAGDGLAIASITLWEIALLIDTLEGYLWDTAYHIQNDADYDVKKTRFGKIFSCDCVSKIILLGLDIDLNRLLP